MYPRYVCIGWLLLICYQHQHQHHQQQQQQRQQFSRPHTSMLFRIVFWRLPGSTRSNSPTNASKATTCIMASTCSRRSNKSCSYPASLSSVSWANRPMLSKIANRIAVLRPCMDRRNEPNKLLGSMMCSICYLIGFAMLKERVSKCIFIRRSNTFSTWCLHSLCML